jgi:hypothetical protein
MCHCSINPFGLKWSISFSFGNGVMRSKNSDSVSSVCGLFSFINRFGNDNKGRKIETRIKKPDVRAKKKEPRFKDLTKKPQPFRVFGKYAVIKKPKIQKCF